MRLLGARLERGTIGSRGEAGGRSLQLAGGHKGIENIFDQSIPLS